MIIKLIDVRVVGNDLVVLTDAINSQKVPHQIDVDSSAFYQNEDLGLFLIH